MSAVCGIELPPPAHCVAHWQDVGVNGVVNRLRDVVSNMAVLPPMSLERPFPSAGDLVRNGAADCSTCTCGIRILIQRHRACFIEER